MSHPESPRFAPRRPGCRPITPARVGPFIITLALPRRLAVVITSIVIAAIAIAIAANTSAHADSAAPPQKETATITSAAPIGAARIPADVDLFIQFEQLAQWRHVLRDQPLVRYLAALIRDAGLIETDQAAAWRTLSNSLGLTGEQMFDRYLGRRAVIAARLHESPSAGLFLTVAPADAHRLAQRLPWRELDGADGYRMLEAVDGRSRAAIARDWIILAEASDHALLDAAVALDDPAASLAANPRFHRRLAELAPTPASAHRAAVGYLRLPDEIHLGAVDRDDAAVWMQYRGHSPAARHTPLLRQLGSADMPMPPLPRSTFGVLAVNLLPEPSAALDQLDPLTSPTSFRRDILPHLQPPVVLFLSEAPPASFDQPQQSTPANAAGSDQNQTAAEGGQPQPPPPALTLAIHLKDPDAAAAIDAVIRRIVIVGNLTAIGAGLPPLALKPRSHAKTDYLLLDARAAARQLFQSPHAQHVTTPAFGRVGNWYILTSHQAILQQCIDLHADDHAPRWAGWSRSTSLHNQTHDNAADTRVPLYRMQLETDPLRSQLIHWTSLISRYHAHIAQDAQKLLPETARGRALRLTQLLSHALAEYKSVAAHGWLSRDDDRVTIGAELQVIAKQPSDASSIRTVEPDND